MKIMLLAASFAVVTMTLVPAVFDGQRRFRWGQDTEIAELAARLNNFPKQIGSWEMVSESEMSEGSADQLEPLASVSRFYSDAVSGKRVQVFILLGPTGPTAVHTPDICFNSTEYRKLGERHVTAITSESSSFVTMFETRNASKHFLKSWYAWTVDGTWSAPERPRFQFAKSRTLLKVQMVAEYANRESMESDKTTQQFVADIERTIRSQLF